MLEFGLFIVSIIAIAIFIFLAVKTAISIVRGEPLDGEDQGSNDDDEF